MGQLLLAVEVEAQTEANREETAVLVEQHEEVTQTPVLVYLVKVMMAETQTADLMAPVAEAEKALLGAVVVIAQEQVTVV